MMKWLKSGLSILIILSLVAGNFLKENQVVYANENSDNQSSQFEISSQYIAQRFGTTEAFIQGQLNSGYSLNQIYSAFVYSGLKSVSYQDAIYKLFPEEQNLSTSITSDVYEEPNDSILDLPIVLKEDAPFANLSVSGVAYGELNGEESSVEDVVYRNSQEFKQDISVAEAAYAVKSEPLALVAQPEKPITISVPPEFSRQSINQAPYSVNSDAESISSMTGDLSIQQTDMELPGRNGLSFALTRKYNSSSSQLYDMDVGEETYSFDVLHYYVEYSGNQQSVSKTYSVKYIEDMWVEEDYNGDGQPDNSTYILESTEKLLGNYATKTEAESARTALARRGKTYNTSYISDVRSSSIISSSTSSFPNSVSYNSDGYTGTLFKKGSPTLNSGEYKNAETKPKSDICTNAIPGIYNSSGNWVATGTGNSCPSSIDYSDADGFSGTLSRGDTTNPKPCSSPGTPGYICTKTYIANYSGNVTRPAKDTRNWKQDYEGTVGKNSWTNSGSDHWRYVYDVRSTRINENEVLGPSVPVTLESPSIFENYVDAIVEVNRINSLPGRYIGDEDGYRYYAAATPKAEVHWFSVGTGFTTNYFGKTKPKVDQQTYPIGAGWSWNLPYIESDDDKKYLNMADGSKYEIEGNKIKGSSWEGTSINPDNSVTVNDLVSANVLVTVDGLTRQYFDADGRLLQISDNYNNTIKFKYEQSLEYNRKVLSQVEDAIGNTINISYSPSEVTLTKSNEVVKYTKGIEQGVEVLSSVQDAEGRLTSYMYFTGQAKFNLFADRPDRAVSNPYALLEKVTYPTGAVTTYKFESSPVSRYIGANAVNEVYRLSDRYDEIHYNNGSTLEYNRKSINYNSSDYASSYNQDLTFSNTMTDGLVITQYQFKKKFVNDSTPAQYYLEQSTAMAEGTEKKTVYAYNKIVGARTYPVSEPTSIVSSDNRTSDVFSTSIQYDDYGNVLQKTDPTGKTSNYTYDNSRHLIQTAVEPVDNTRFKYTLYERNALGKLTQVISRKDNATGQVLQQFTYSGYDSYGNLQAMTLANGAKPTTIQYEYSSVYSGAFLTKESTQFHDVNGILIVKAQSAKYEKSTGLMNSYKDGRELETSYTYDKLGRILNITYPNHESSSIAYDDMGNIVTFTNEEGNQSQVGWNALGWKISESIKDSTGFRVVQSYEHDAYGRLRTSVDALGKKISYEYDNWDRLKLTTFPDSSTVRTLYDDVTRQVLSTDAEDAIQMKTYDKWGQLHAEFEKSPVTQLLTQLSNQQVDAVSGLLQSVKDGEQNLTAYTYDYDGKLKTVTNAKNETTSYDYDLQGNMTRITFPDSSFKQYVYDELGQMIQQINEEGTNELNEYDLNGNPLFVTDRMGNKTSFVFDSRNRMLKKINNDETVEFKYDKAGRRTYLIDDTGPTKYDYDSNTGQLKTVTYPDGLQLSNIQYEANGNRSQATGPFGQTVYWTYDSMHRLKTTGTNVNPEMAEAKYSYYDNSMLHYVDQSNGVQTEYEYDGMKLTKMSQKLNQQSVGDSWDYGYDNNHNITSVKTNGSTTHFAYDKLNRIESSPELQEKYNYDNRGNRIVMESSHGMVLTDSKYTYDKQNRLIRAEQDGKIVQYKYNGDGLMVERTESGQKTRYYYDGDQIIAEAEVINGHPQFKAAYLRGARLEAIVYNDSKAFFSFNGHGDVTSLRGADGGLLNSYKYDVWGNIQSKTELIKNPFLYSGEYWDSTTELQYLRARWYDPSVGRFINEDTFEGQIDNPLTLNLYTYVHNNPLLYTDPSGHIIVFPNVKDLWNGSVKKVKSTLKWMESENKEMSDFSWYYKMMYGDMIDSFFNPTYVDAASAIGGLKGPGKKSGIKIPVKTKTITEVSKDLSKIAGKYRNCNLTCTDAAKDMKAYMVKNGIKGMQVEVKYEGGRGWIWSDSAGKSISENGYHTGILYEGKVYDNIHPNGIEYQKWLDDLHATGTRKTKDIKIN
ncbi:RHS repeat-associated core domain-containing protein [Cohnella sp. GCM10020058]|uniref:RHS repeat-associated core domain-containing protein n=1 Tax=Cohnella sp. GCM10020058 TaxID=3317330 RepID=UPI003630CB58